MKSAHSIDFSETERYDRSLAGPLCGILQMRLELPQVDSNGLAVAGIFSEVDNVGPTNADSCCGFEKGAVRSVCEYFHNDASEPVF